ncbi:MAG: fatty-acyl-CoA synthase, partial [Mycobacterium sp.]|nr:fatty-acyl-CoA synthase [Mycobacterium sp.]
MPSETIQQLLRELATSDAIAVKHGDRQWTWREHLRDGSVRAAALLTLVDPDRPAHVGVLLGNTPEFLSQMAAAGLGGYVLCGLNTTRRGAALAADIRKADCQIVVTDAEHRALLDGVDLPGVRVLDSSGEDWVRLLESAGELSPHREVEPLDPYMLIFTSGTSGDPKAVKVSHFMVLMSGA